MTIEDRPAAHGTKRDMTRKWPQIYEMKTLWYFHYNTVKFKTPILQVTVNPNFPIAKKKKHASRNDSEMAANSINLKFDLKNVRWVIFAAVSEVQKTIYRSIQSIAKFRHLVTSRKWPQKYFCKI